MKGELIRALARPVPPSSARSDSAERTEPESDSANWSAGSMIDVDVKEVL